MTLVHILVLTIFAALVGIVIPLRWRASVLLFGCLGAIYWLQPSSPIRHLDFWLPTASILLTIFVWAVTQSPGEPDQRKTFTSALIVLGVVLFIGLGRSFEPLCCLTTSRPPAFLTILKALSVSAIIILIPYRLLPQLKIWSIVTFLMLLAIFILLKTPKLALNSSSGLRALTGQSTELASALDIPWLGFSYLAFRLLHTLRDYQSGKLPAYSLKEYLIYGLFFSSYTAGPIDRSQHMITELRDATQTAQNPADQHTPTHNASNQRHFLLNFNAPSSIQGSQRILLGIFKKFVLADSLALISLNPQNALQLNSTPWAWILVYAYTLRIFFDFAGYTDIAIGMGQLIGIKLPENFDRPYLKQNLTDFWNSWHITLAQWFRAYFFNPLTRALRMKPRELPTWVIIMLGQTSTMLLIGLWHGITLNFAVWGLWHGVGLFIHNRWSGWMRPRFSELKTRPVLQRSTQIGGWLLTFHFVALSWVWFILPNPTSAWHVFQKLFGG